MNKLLEILDKVTAGIKNEILLSSIAVIILLVIAPAESKLLILCVYVVAVFGCVFYMRVVRHREEPESHLQVHADMSRSRDYNLLEILNTGSENIINLKVEISWSRSKEGPQNRHLTRFFGEGEDPVKMPAREMRSLRTGERVYASSIPLYSCDGQIRVRITGEGSGSHKPLDYSTIVENTVETS